MLEIFKHAEKALEDENLEEMQIAASSMRAVIRSFHQGKDAESITYTKTARKGLAQLIEKIARLA